MTVIEERKMTTHTPGPWFINTGPYEYCGARIDGSNGRSLAHAVQRDSHPTIGQGIPQAEADANARLICAAPDLLEALIAIRSIEFGHSDADICKVRADADAAIAKATGAA
jgi:hypothetical protein